MRAHARSALNGMRDGAHKCVPFLPKNVYDLKKAGRQATNKRAWGRQGCKWS